MTDFFENLNIDINSLPSSREESFQNLEKTYRKVSLIACCIFYIVVAIGIPLLFYFNDGLHSKTFYLWVALGSVLILWLIHSLFIIAAFKKKKYCIRQKDLVYSKGLIWSKRTTIPFNRIQHAEVKQGPIERIFKLHNLKVFTAGGNSSDLSIPGLTEDQATKIKEFILNQIETEEELENEH